MLTKLLRMSSFLQIFVLCIILQSSAFASKQKERWVTVPVLYATTRAYDSKLQSFVGTRGFKDDTQNVKYGIATVTLSIPDNSKLSASIKQSLQLKESSDAHKEQCVANDESRDAFFTEARTRNDKVAQKETCVFVHGYNTSFAGAADSAARLELALGEPVILFSWPSASKLKKYTVDECNAEWSERGFQVFMQGLEKEIDSEHLMTVSHSMGNRLINWYMSSRYDKANEAPKHFKEIVLTSPDIDRGTFKNYFFKVAKNADRTRIYVSGKDLPLRLSGFVHGSAREGALASVDDPKWDKPGDVPNTETLNFTAADKGFIGHSIQFDIIANMHGSGEPGPHLVCERDSGGKKSYFTIKKEVSGKP